MKGCKTGALLPLILIVLLAAGCSTPSAKDQQAGAPPKKIDVDTGLAPKVVLTAKTVPGVQDATAVVVNRGILVGVTVTGFDRLRLKPIKSGVLNKVKTVSPGYGVLVTADKKLFRELQGIEGQIGAGGYDPAPILQKLKKLRKDMGD